jgi:hypothetical protein
MARNGILTGTIPALPAVVTRFYRPSVVAFRLDAPGDARAQTPGAARTFRLAVPPGLWAVLTPAWVAHKLTSKVTVVPVPSGKTIPVRSVLRGRTPPDNRVSVTPFTVTVPGAEEMRKGMSDMVGAGLVDPVLSKCKDSAGQATGAVVLDRGDKYFKALLAELRLGRSHFAAPEGRAQARSALANLPKWAPNYTATGTVTSIAGLGGATTTSVTAKVLHSGSGQTAWEKTYTSDSTKDLYDLAGEIASDISDELCAKAPPVLHVSLTGTFTGSDAKASATAVVAAEYDVNQRPGDLFNYASPSPVSWTILSSSVTSNDDCPKISTGPRNATPFLTPTTGAATITRKDPRIVTLYLSSSVVAPWVETKPPVKCTGGGAVGMLFAGLMLPVPLGGTQTVTGATMPSGTYTLTATVTKP